MPISPATNNAVSSSKILVLEFKEAKPPPKPAYQLKLPSNFQTHWYNPINAYGSNIVVVTPTESKF